MVIHVGVAMGIGICWLCVFGVGMDVGSNTVTGIDAALALAWTLVRTLSLESMLALALALALTLALVSALSQY